MTQKNKKRKPNPAGLANLERSLEAACEKIGDITETTLARFYHRSPIADEIFSRYEGEKRKDLEAAMIEQILYCIMVWYERPIEIEIILYETVPHHMETLKVPVSTFYALMEALLDTLVDATDSSDQAALDTLEELRHDIGELIKVHDPKEKNAQASST